MPAPAPPPSSTVESWIEKIVDGDEGSVPRQVFIGGVAGWMTGFIAMKMGKAAATAVGGGIILLQIANYKGYININWNRLNKDVETMQKKIVQDGRKKDWTDKIRTYAQENTYRAVGFGGGFLLEKNLNKAADKAEDLVNRGQASTRRWYQKFTTGEDPRIKDMQVFFTAFTAGVALGIITIGK